MALTRQYLIPTESMTLTDQREYRQKALIALVERAVDKKIGDETDLARVQRNEDPVSLRLREWQNILDAVAALDQWNTAALAAVGIAYSVFQAVAAPVMNAARMAVFYKVSIETVPVPVSRLLFRDGGALGDIIGQFDLEPLAVHDPIEGFFSEPVVIDPSQTFAAQVLARTATGVLARVQLGSFVAERRA